MKCFRVGGLTDSGWQGMSDRIRLKRVNSNGSVRQKRAEPGAKFGEWLTRCSTDDILLIGFDSPATSISAALNAGRGADEALTQWIEEAGAALSAVEENPHRVHLVSVGAALLAPQELVGALALRTGLTFSTRKCQEPSARHLVYWDLGDRLARDNAAAVEQFENLRASSLFGEGKSEPRPTAFNEAAEHHRLAQLAHRAAIDKLNQTLSGVARGEVGFTAAARSLKGGVQNGDDVATLYDAVTGLLEQLEARSKGELSTNLVVEGDKVLAQSALTVADAETASLEIPCKSLNQRATGRQGAAAHRSAMPTEQRKSAAESVLTQAVLAVVATDVARAEADADIFREAFELIVEDLVSEVSAGSTVARNWPTSASVLQQQLAPGPGSELSPRAPNGKPHWLSVLRDYWLISRSSLFNKDWYRKQYPDLAGSRDLLLHYLLYGGAEGRSPSPFFCSQQYLDHYGDVRASRVNPLAHYLRAGRKEGRLVFPVFETSHS